jgi:hypothetical protein
MIKMEYFNLIYAVTTHPPCPSNECPEWKEGVYSVGSSACYGSGNTCYTCTGGPNGKWVDHCGQVGYEPGTLYGKKYWKRKKY